MDCAYILGCRNHRLVRCPNHHCQCYFCLQHCDPWTHGCEPWGNWVNTQMPTVSITGTEGAIFLKHPILYTRLRLWLADKHILGLADNQHSIVVFRHHVEDDTYQFLLKEPHAPFRASPCYGSLEALLDALDGATLERFYRIIQSQSLREREWKGALCGPVGVIDATPPALLRRVPPRDEGATVLLVPAMEHH